MSGTHLPMPPKIESEMFAPSDPGARVEPFIGPNRKPMPPMNAYATDRIELKFGKTLP